MAHRESVGAMTDIDWLAVDMVCTGTPLKLRKAERVAAVRRMAERMLKPSEHDHDGRKLSCTEVARRLQVDERSVLRYSSELPPGEKKRCPVCRQDMWVVFGAVEPHSNSIFQECVISGRQMLSGLAAERPDLYGWVS